MVGIYLSFRVDKALYREHAGVSGDLLGTSGGGGLLGVVSEKRPPHRAAVAAGGFARGASRPRYPKHSRYVSALIHMVVRSPRITTLGYSNAAGCRTLRRAVADSPGLIFVRAYKRGIKRVARVGCSGRSTVARGGPALPRQALPGPALLQWSIYGGEGWAYSGVRSGEERSKSCRG